MKYTLVLIITFFINLNLFSWNTPVLSSPSNGALNQYTGLGLNWNAVSNSDGYELELDTSSTFNSSLLKQHHEVYINSSSGNPDTYEFFEDLYFNQKYYWRVRAYKTGDTSSWSNVRDFTTRNKVSLTSPSNTAINQYTGIGLNWYANDYVDFYDLEFDTSSNFNSPLLVSHKESYINGSNDNSDTYELIEDLYFNKKYYWRVRARNGVDTSSWGDIWSFTTSNKVFLTSPLNNATNLFTGLGLNWYANDYVDFYDLEFDTSSNFNSPLLVSHTESYIDGSNYNSDTYELIEDLYFNKKYYWRVRARNGVDTSSWGDTWSFTTRNNVSLTSPLHLSTNISVNGVNLNWYADNYVNFYEVEIDTSVNFNSSLLYRNTKTYISTSSIDTDTYESIGALLSNTVYYWRVRAINATDTSLWTTRIFSTGSNIVPETPNLIYPSNLSVGIPNTTNIDWSNVSTASSFEYEYSLDSTFSVSNIGFVSNSIVSISGLTSLKKYYWRVRAYNSNGVSLWSDVWSFKIGITTQLNEINNSSISIFPNPSTNGVFNILSNIKLKEIQLYSISGKVVYENLKSNNFSVIDLSNFKSGMYIVKLQNEKGEEVIKKIIKK